MKALLLYKDRDLDLESEIPEEALDLEKDLGLEQIIEAMADGDQFVGDVSRRALGSSLQSVDQIRYRQEVLLDCIRNSDAVRDLYGSTIEVMKEAGKVYFGHFIRLPSSVLHSSIEVLRILVRRLHELRRTAEEQEPNFQSEGFRKLFAMLKRELSDDYFAEVNAHLKKLAFKDGVLQSARLGRGNAGVDYVLRRPNDDPRNWFRRIFTKGPQSFSFRIADRDDAGARALSALRDRGLNLVANAAAQSKDHILSFFANLKTDLAFYVGCLNLRRSLTSLGLPTVLPEPSPPERRRHSFEGLYDPGLALTVKMGVVGNSLNLDGHVLTVITGANQGGKTTFLRSVGAARLMMQSGMFVAADRFDASLCRGIFSHFRRKEDTDMESGKFDEELRRMSNIVDDVGTGSMVLFNESFAATNEREGSEVARQITTALVEKGVQVAFVTHMYQYARTLYDARNADFVFLQPERRADGTRTFKLVEGEPLSTSFGPDLYRQIFVSETGQPDVAPEACEG